MLLRMAQSKQQQHQKRFVLSSQMSDTVYAAPSDKNCSITYTSFSSTLNKESTLHFTLSLDRSYEHSYEITFFIKSSNPAGIYLFKVNNRNTRTRCKICSKLTIKIPEQRHWRRSGIFIVNFEHI